MYCVGNIENNLASLHYVLGILLGSQSRIEYPVIIPQLAAICRFIIQLVRECCWTIIFGFRTTSAIWVFKQGVYSTSAEIILGLRIIRVNTKHTKGFLRFESE